MSKMRELECKNCGDSWEEDEELHGTVETTHFYHMCHATYCETNPKCGPVIVKREWEE